MDGVGISAANTNMIQNEVSIILHCAANVAFNNPIKNAVESNVAGALRMLELARSCPKLLALIHVSTCYVNSILHIGKEHIEEKVYPFQYVNGV